MQRMKKLIVGLMSLLFFFRGFSQPTNALDAQVETLLSGMSLDEKIGQMVQITLDVLTVPGSSPIKLDEDKLREAIVTNQVGSILNTGLNHALSLDEWRYVNKTIQDMALSGTPHKIPVLYGIDSIHGATYVLGSTLFPENLDMAATRNPDLLRRCEEISAAETRAAGLRWTFAPVLDVGRQPLWARFSETFGEDPYLAGVLGAAAVHGFQGADVSKPPGIAACMKHYFGYSFPFDGKDRTPALMSDHYLRENFLPPFREAVKAGVKTVMVNSGEVNGIPVHASKYMLTDILRGELGFQGLVVSDWEDIKHLHDWYHVAGSQQDAVRIGVEAGIDMSMVPTDYSFGTLLKALVQQGTISERRIDESVRRILKLKAELGLLKNPYVEADAAAGFGRPEYQKVALQAAEEAVILLKNSDARLPLARSTKVLVTGPAARSRTALNGPWSYTWQGVDDQWFPKSTLSIEEAIREKIGPTNVLYQPGADFSGQPINPDGVVADARLSDVIVLCLGEESYAEAVGDIPDLTLPRGQLDLAERLYATGKPIVLVLVEGRGRLVREIEPDAEAILFAGQPGSQGGPAIANILFGDTNPSGKLPFTYQRYPNNLLTYDRAYIDNRAADFPPVGFKGVDFTPQWEFGAGLSYTTFDYKNLKVSAPVLKGSGKITVSVDVTNTGKRAGKEAVELYTHEICATLTPPLRRLRAFKKLELRPGETVTVSFDLTAADLAFVNAQSQLVTEPGDFEAIINGQKVGFKYEE
jgi:beta-glucosidase